MPRRLPWLAEKATESVTKKGHSSSSPAPRRGRDMASDDLVDSDLNAIHPTTPPRRQKKRPIRSPSTSPPPAPPDVVYMNEGYDADDVYMMVEDEFFSTAKLFTQHLHHAEYVKYKKLAASRGANVLNGLVRAVDGKTEQSRGLKMHMEAEDNQKSIKNKLKAAAGREDESSEEDEYKQDPQLAGLMVGAAHVSTDLTSLAKTKLKTRAAAGLSQSPRNIERTKNALVEDVEINTVAATTNDRRVVKEEEFSETDDDDLDAPPANVKRPVHTNDQQKQSSINGERDRPDVAKEDKASKGDNIFKQFARPVNVNARNGVETGESPATTRPNQNNLAPSPTKNDIKGSNARSAASEFLAKRRAEKERKQREEKRKANGAIDVPTFAI